MSRNREEWRKVKLFTTVDDRYSTNRRWPCPDEEIGGWHIHRDRVRANVLVYVITMARNSVLYGGLYLFNNQLRVNVRFALTSYHLEDRNTKPNKQIEDDSTALLRSCGHRNIRRSNLIEAAGDTK
jgi:hypothetical protein